LSPSIDPREIAALLTTVLTDPALAERLGAAAARRVRESFSWPVVAERLIGEIGSTHAESTP